MKKKEFQDFVRTILSAPVDGLDWNGKLAFIQNEAFKMDKEFNDDPIKKGQPWTDDELRLVLSMPATTDSVCLLAKALGRGHGSIEQIFRWAGQSPSRIEAERSDDKFIQQIVKIRKELGWRSIGGNT